MGLYIEVPHSKSKAAQILTLSPEAKMVSDPPEWEDIPEGMMVVCVVDNGPFEAAHVSYTKREYSRVLHPDSRPRTWLLVPVSFVREHAPAYDIYCGN